MALLPFVKFHTRYLIENAKERVGQAQKGCVNAAMSVSNEKAG